MTLPILTTSGDVRAIVSYLRNKPTGATNQEARAALKEQVLDSRKIRAYESWGLITRDGDRLKLNTRGWELARKPETDVQVFRAIINSVHPPYRSALEWAHYQSFDALTSVDVAAHWHDHHLQQVGTTNEITIGYMAVCFFHVCQAAGLGKLVMGRKGQATRLVIDRGALREFVEESEPLPAAETEASAVVGNGNGARSGDDVSVAPITAEPPTAGGRERLRMFISHGRNLEVVDQIATMLEIADIDGEIAEKEETGAIPVPDKVFNAMRRCDAGIIAVTVDEGRKDKDGNYSLNENVLIEIGAAFVLYERRVVLLWDKRLPVPSNLQGLYRCEFEGNELTWSAAMKLMKTIQTFKDAAKREAARSQNLTHA